MTSAGVEPPSGVMANAFTSVSLVPPLVLVCLNRASSTARTIARNRVFAVNVLGADQEGLSRRFAAHGRPRGSAAFSDVPHRIRSTGSPVLDGVACWLDCRLAGLHVAGDHRIVIGEVLAFDRRPDLRAARLSRRPVPRHARRRQRLRCAKRDPYSPYRLHPKGGEMMKKFSVRTLETLKTTAALYPPCCPK